MVVVRDHGHHSADISAMRVVSFMTDLGSVQPPTSGKYGTRYRVGLGDGNFRRLMRPYRPYREAGDYTVWSTDFESYATGWGGTTFSTATPARSGTKALTQNSYNVKTHTTSAIGAKPTLRSWVEGDYVLLKGYVRLNSIAANGSVGMSYGSDQSTDTGSGSALYFTSSGTVIRADNYYWTTSKQTISGAINVSFSDTTSWHLLQVKLLAVYGGDANKHRIEVDFAGNTMDADTISQAMPTDDYFAVTTGGALGNLRIDDVQVILHLATDDAAT